MWTMPLFLPLRRRPPEDVDRARDIVVAVPPAGVLCQRDPGPGHLTVTRGAAQLGNGFDDLSQARRTDGVTAGQEAAAGIDRQRAAEPGLTASDQRRAAARLSEAELLVYGKLRGHGRVLDPYDFLIAQLPPTRPYNPPTTPPR